jgi:hypothetical protein
VLDILKEDNLLLPTPTLWDTVGFKILKLPLTAPGSILSFSQSFMRHSIQGLEYSDEEKIRLLEGAVGEWDTLSAKHKAELLECEGWKQSNLEAWRKKNGKKAR